MVKIPNRLEDLYPAGAVEKLLDTLQQPDLSGKLREALGKVGLGEVNPLEQAQQAWQQARSWIESLATDTAAGREPTLINATGQLFGERLARVPTTSTVAHAYANAAIRFQNADVITTRTRATVRNAFGNAAACWQSSTKAALDSLVGSKTVHVAKTDLVRIPGLGDVGAMLSNLAVSEVGASNGCSQSDWQQAIGLSKQSDSQCVLLVSPNGVPRSLAQRQRADAIEVASQPGIPVFELLADGVVHSSLADEYGFPAVGKRLQEQADVVLVPLNLLLGGPAGVLVAGTECHLQPVQRSAHLNGTELAGPELQAANVAIQLSLLDDELSTWPAASLLINQENLQNRAQRIAIQLNDNGVIKHAQETQHATALGEPPWDRYGLQNWAVEIQPNESSAELAERLRSGERETSTQSGDADTTPTPIECVPKDDRLLLDLRFVDPKDDHLLVSALS